jgi:hypothetical protein
MLERSVPQRQRRNGSMMPMEDQSLYELAWTALETVELIGKRASCWGKGVGIMKRSGRWKTGEWWEVRFQGESVLRYSRGEWRTGEGKGVVVAREEEVEKKERVGEGAYKVLRVMVVEGGVDRKMVNLLVACWTARVWRELVRERERAEKMVNIWETLKTGSRFELGFMLLLNTNSFTVVIRKRSDMPTGLHRQITF